MTRYCPRDLTFPLQTYFDRHVFQHLISLVLSLNNSFLVVLSLVFRLFYGVSIRFNYFLANFWRFLKKSPDIQDADQDGRHSDILTHL